MSVEGDLFRVTVKGSRESIVKMMNAALKSFGSDNVIAESDDIDTMNSKLEMFTGKEGKDIGIPDLLGPGNEVSVYRYLELVRIEDDAPGLTAKFSYYINEGASYEEDNDVVRLVGWEAVALRYNCTVFLDDDWHCNGQFIRFGAATIYAASDGELHRLHLESGSIYDDKEYPFFVKTLAKLYPDHYRVDWEHYQSNHPEVEISEDECLAWFNEQKQPWDQEVYSETEEVEPGSLSHLIDENGHAVIPEGTTEIIEMAFQDCTTLVSVEIPSSVRVINYGAFYGCTGLTSIVIPEGVEQIWECAFKGCTSLTSVTLPKSIKQVSFDAFDGCPCEDEVYSNLPEDKIC
ncbi:MAG: leucine-rich repeat domain-containing protein [Candidatus Cryptobacteroides sp.]|nr:leucine-rich repeat domain-containing protein [Candidatus Cryptobacteroides sp.]